MPASNRGSSNVDTRFAEIFGAIDKQREHAERLHRDQMDQLSQMGRDQTSAFNGLAEEIRGFGNSIERSMRSAILEITKTGGPKEKSSQLGLAVTLITVMSLIIAAITSPLISAQGSMAAQIEVMDERLREDDLRERKDVAEMAAVRAKIASDLKEVETQFRHVAAIQKGYDTRFAGGSALMRSNQKLLITTAEKVAALEREDDTETVRSLVSQLSAAIKEAGRDTTKTIIKKDDRP